MSILIEGMEMPKFGYRTVEIAFDADGHPMALADGGEVFDVIPVPPRGMHKVKDCIGWVEKKPWTNYDRLTHASMEEMASIIVSFRCPYERCFPEGGENCKKCWLDWLREEVQDGEG